MLRTSIFTPQLEQKNGRRSALYFLLLGVRFDRQSTGLIEIAMDIVPRTSLANTMGGTNLVHKRLGGTVAGTAVGCAAVALLDCASAASKTSNV